MKRNQLQLFVLYYIMVFTCVYLLSIKYQEPTEVKQPPVSILLKQGY